MTTISSKEAKRLKAWLIEDPCRFVFIDRSRFALFKDYDDFDCGESLGEGRTLTDAMNDADIPM